MKFGILVALVLLASFLLILKFVEWENQPDALTSTTATLTIYGEAENKAGQKLIKIQYKQISSWMKQNPNAKIISISSVNDGAYGRITSFIIIYEEVSNESAQVKEEHKEAKASSVVVPSKPRRGAKHV